MNRTISIVVPVYNEQKHIKSVYRRSCEVFGRLPYDFEILFVDDGSEDESGKRIQELVREDTRIKHLRFSRNFGKEAATSAGLAEASGDAVILIDADLQHPPELIPELVAAWENGADVVIGVRRPRVREGFIRKLGSRTFSRLMNTIGDVKTPLGATDFRLIDREVVDAFCELREHHRMTRALIDWLGFRRAYISFDAAEREGDCARYSFSKLFGLALSTLIAHTKLPLRIVGYLGVFITVFASGLGFVVIVEQFLLGDPFGLVVSGTAMLAIMILFLNGIVLIAMGLMSLYIGTIQEESANRPLYVLRRPRLLKDD